MSTLETGSSGIQQKLLWAGTLALGTVSFGIVALSRAAGRSLCRGQGPIPRVLLIEERARQRNRRAKSVER